MPRSHGTKRRYPAYRGGVNRESDLRDLAVARLGTLVEHGDLPAVSYAVVADGELTLGGHGGTGEDSVFQIGSVTKGLTGLLLADLAARGQVSLSDRATDYLPGASPGPATLLDLATHAAGLPRLPSGMRRYALLRPYDPYAWYPAGRFLREARRSLASAAGGQPYLYSNYGFGLLGYLLGQAAGTDYEPLLADRVCGPLGLRATAFDARPVQGHQRGRPAPPWHLGMMSAAGGLYSTAADMARLLTALLEPDGTPLDAAIRAAVTPRAEIGPGAEIGLAWHHALRDGQRVIWHNGMTGGYSAIVAVNPARRAGIAALANGAGPLPSPLDAPVIDALFRS
jgi:CubicO group peptidase (beta-lactamase class C family)